YKVTGVQTCALPILMEGLLGWPLEAHAISVRIVEIQLLHAIVRDLRLFQSKAAPGQVNVRRSYIRTSEVEASIVVRNNASGIRSRGSLVFFARRVQHQLHAFEPQQRPIE